MKALYVGTLTPGSTSLMRASWLRRITPEWEWDGIDTDAIIIGSPRLWQSAAYRYQIGTAVNRVNAFVLSKLSQRKFDLIWVDKAIFLRPSTVQILRESTRRLVHYTPDTAFYNGRSRHFESSLCLYDLLVTTKSFDVPEYLRLARRNSVHLTTQGYDPQVHFPRNGDDARRKAVAFVGLAEPDRELAVESLLRSGINVVLAGSGWDRLVSANARNANLDYRGGGVFGDDYATLLSTAWIGLGALSKRFPELHTTRTFEIPACGAVLATESNPDTSSFFNDDEALFFNDYRELAQKISDAFRDPGDASLRQMAERGRRRIEIDRRDYESILSRVLADERVALT